MREDSQQRKNMKKSFDQSEAEDIKKKHKKEQENYPSLHQIQGPEQKTVGETRDEEEL